MLQKIISGGQTGVDRAALDVAMELGIACGGWCPKGRLAEDGAIPERYPLKETPKAEYPQRTEWNVRDSDATLILRAGGSDRGTSLTETLAGQHGKLCLAIELDRSPSVSAVQSWIQNNRIRVLNVAGPRESSSEGIYHKAVELLRRVLGEEKA
jgi:hypothetical protein